MRISSWEITRWVTRLVQAPLCPGHVGDVLLEGQTGLRLLGRQRHAVRARQAWIARREPLEVEDVHERRTESVPTAGIG
jgi:hypothetical protein